MDEQPQFIIKKIETSDPVNIKAGSDDFEPLKRFLRHSAIPFQNSHIAITYIVCEVTASNPDDIIRTVGYITITNSEIDLCGTYSIEECAEADKYNSMPAVKIARLLIDRRFRDNDLGTYLFNYILALVTDHISPHVGCRFLITDAKPSAINFYLKMGFILLDSDENRAKPEPIMFLDLAKVNGKSQPDEPIEEILADQVPSQ